MPRPDTSPTLKWTGTKGDDTAYVPSVDALSRTTYDAGTGYDTLDLSALSAGISVSILLGKPGNSNIWPDSPFSGSWFDFNLQGARRVDGTLKNFERIVGTNYNDYLQLRGGSVARVVDSGAGDDAIYMAGSSGSDTAIGGLGSDQLFGGYNSDLLIGGTYSGGVAPGDDTRDEFTASAGTILDFELDVDSLYIDAWYADSPTTDAIWVDVTTTSYGSGAQLVISPDRIINVIGITAEELNSIPKGYLYLARGGDWTGGAGDDLIFDTSSSTSVDRFIFPTGSGSDVVVGFDVDYDTLVFADSPTFTQVDYHGEAALLATYDGGASFVLLPGLSSADEASLTVDIMPQPEPLI